MFVYISFIFSICLNIFLFWKSVKFKRLGVITRNQFLQGKGHSEIKITFRGQEISNLRKVYLCIFNYGNETIKSSDISPSQPIGILLIGDDKLFEYDLVECTNILSNVRLKKDEKDENYIITKFDYLNPNDGFVVRMVYERGERKNVDEDQKNAGRYLTGEIIGAREPVSITNNEYRGILSFIGELIPGIFTLIFGIVIINASVFNSVPFTDVILKDNPSVVGNIIAFLVGVFVIFIATTGFITSFKKPPRRIPKSFVKYLDDDMFYQEIIKKEDQNKRNNDEADLPQSNNN